MTKKTKKTNARPFAQDLAGPSVTQQHFKDECDINNIVAKYTRTGIDPFPERNTAKKFGFASSQDFAESAFAVAEIRSAFAQLPSAERSAHANDPERWFASHLEATQDPETNVDSEAPESPSEIIEKEPEKAPENPPPA